MRTKYFEIARKHNKLLIVFLGITCLFLIPIQTPITSIEENPDDSRALSLSKETSVSIHLTDIPTATSAIALWASDSMKTPPTTPVEVHVDTEEAKSIPLKKLLSGERQLKIQLPRRTTNNLEISLRAPTLDTKKALLVRTAQDNKDMVAYTLYERMPLIQTLLHTLYAHNATADDIEYVWREGAGILQGGNPYEKAAHAAHWENKYATYFPLSYIISAGIQKSGAASFSSWLAVVRPIVFASQLLTAILVLVFLYSQKKLTLGIFGFFLILFHRFTLYPAQTSQIDFPAIMFLVMGLFLLQKKIKMGHVVIGISLAIKQMAVILLPLFLIWEYSQYKSKKQTGVALLLMLIVPLITLLPFIMSSPEGVRASLSFSANRFSGGDFTIPDISTLLSLTGPSSRIGMYGLMIIIYIAFWKKEIGIFGSCLAIFVIFTGFNPVLFFHYLAWIVPFIPLALAEYKAQSSNPAT
jgi:hypothetical protein